MGFLDTIASLAKTRLAEFCWWLGHTCIVTPKSWISSFTSSVLQQQNSKVEPGRIVDRSTPSFSCCHRYIGTVSIKCITSGHGDTWWKQSNQWLLYAKDLPTLSGLELLFHYHMYNIPCHPFLPLWLMRTILISQHLSNTWWVVVHLLNIKSTCGLGKLLSPRSISISQPLERSRIRSRFLSFTSDSKHLAWLILCFIYLNQKALQRPGT